MTSKETKRKQKGNEDHGSDGIYSLMLHNDDIHSFDYVIDALIDICDHKFEQALQCTLITHHHGRCDVRKGEFDALKKMKDALLARNLNSTITTKP